MATDKDRQIIRQSMAKLVLEYSKTCDMCMTLSDLIKTTTMMEDYCINGYSKEMVAKFDKLDEYLTKEYRGKN